MLAMRIESHRLSIAAADGSPAPRRRGRSGLGALRWCLYDPPMGADDVSGASPSPRPVASADPDGPRLDLDDIPAGRPAPQAGRSDGSPLAPTSAPAQDSSGSWSDRARSSPGRGVAVAVILTGAAGVLPLLRQSGTPSWRTVWAEDGSIYTQEAVRSGPVNVLFRGYAGYLQLPPRLLAVPVTWISIRHLALYAAVVGVVVGVALAGFVYRMSEGWIDSWLVRVVLASFLVLTPTLGFENTANMVNTIWVFAAVAPWALVAVREDRRDTALRAVVAFLAATATPLCVCYVPLALGWLLVRRTRSALAVTGAFLVGLGVQGLVVTHTTDVQSRLVVNQLSTLRDGIGQRVFAQFLLGPRWARSLWVVNWRLSALGSTVIVVSLVIALLPGAGRRAQRLGVLLVLYAVVLFIVPAWGRGTFVLGLFEGGGDLPSSARFAVIPVILLGSGVAVLLSPVGGASRGWVTRVALPLFVAQVALLTLVNYRLPNPRSIDVPWEPKVAAIYREQCLGASPAKLVTVPNPVLALAGYAPFSVTVPCRNLAP
jgi:hypothetical protein